MNPTLIEGCNGFGVGYEYTTLKSKELEVKQGKNDYISSIFQSEQVTYLCSIIEVIASKIFCGSSPLSIKIFTNVTPLAWLSLSLFAVSVKRHDYEEIVSHYSENRIIKFFPKQLSKKTIQVLSFYTEHSSKCIQTAMFTGIVALVYFGHYAFIGAFAATWLYHTMDMQGYVPRKVSLFFETYLPLLSSACLFITGTLLVKILSSLQLVTSFSSLNRVAYHHVDALARYLFSLKGPSLAEYEAPIVEKKYLTIHEINEIINAKGKDFEINPSHCSKLLMGPLSKDYNFTKFHDLYREIPWEQKYPLLKGKLKDDDRFLDFLREKFPEEKDLSKNFDSLIQRLAGNQSKEVYLATWMQSQFTLLIKALQGNSRAMGEQKDLEVAIDNCAIILSYLQNPHTEKIDKEDILLKLAVEGGEYCARGVKRASEEIVTETVISNYSHEAADHQSRYKLKLKQALQNKRRDIIQAFYREIVQNAHVPDAISQDVHGFDIYRKILSLGFFPLTPLERAGLDFGDLTCWIMFTSLRKFMLDSYKKDLNEVVSNQGEIEFANYLRYNIRTNPNLTSEQKETLLEKYTEANGRTWSIKKTNRKFHRLVLVMLGILRKVKI